jgi:hypothetical protein
MAMRTYTLHLPRDAHAGDPVAVERAAMVPDGFSWAAFAFSALWCFRHGLVVAGLLVALAFAALWGLGQLLHLAPGAAALAVLLVSLLVGFEGSSLRRWTYARRGRPTVDAVTAADADEAEAKFLTRALAVAPTPARAVPARPAYARPEDDAVFGLFPQAEGRR